MIKNIYEFYTIERKKMQRVNFEMTYVDIAKGDLISGLLLSQIIYWFSLTESGRYRTTLTYKGNRALAKARSDWYDEIRISPKQYDRAVQILVDIGVVSVQNSMYCGKKTPFIILNESRFLELYNAELKKHMEKEYKEIISGELNDKNNYSMFPKGKNRYSLKVHTDVDEKVSSLTETTTKTTTEKERYIGGDVNNCQMDSKEENLLVVEDSDYINENHSQLNNNSPLDKNTSPLNDNHSQPKDNHLCLEDEALSLLEKMPSKITVKNNYIIEYLKVRTRYSGEELERCVNRYIEYKKLKKENRYHNPENFFRNGVYELFLDKNWDETLKETKKQVNKVENNRKRYSKKPSQEPKVTEEWDNQLKDLGW